MNNPAKRAVLQSERSFDSSTGRLTKYFKLDRTYSDVVEDELYDPQPEKAEVSPPPIPKSSEPRTERIQNAYPQLFTRPPIDSMDRRDFSSARTDQYWPGMESGIRFERDLSDHGRTDSSVIADRKQKLKQQPEQSTVSPKEAFLDYPDNADFDPKGSVFDHSGNGNPTQRAREKSPPRVGRTMHFPPQVVSQLTSEIATPKTITPVRAHEKLSPKPVTSSSQGVSSPGPSRDQASNNAAANAQIRALYKEESTVSNTSIGSEINSPPSVAESDSESSPQDQPVLRQNSPEAVHQCPVCSESFDRTPALELHMRIHARPPPGPLQHNTKPENYPDEAFDEDEQDEDEYGDTGNRGGGRSRNKTGGPHRCDWVIPATGQVCGTIFSRPYDLVRHQDTIHRAKKLEFKCEICIGTGTNKVFSRNDALVRHMRHVHKRSPK